MPLPEPLAADVMVTHESDGVAVHVQPVVVVTAKLPVPPVAGSVALVG